MAVTLRPARRVALIVLAMALAIVGCSGADDSNGETTTTSASTTTTPPPSPEELAGEAAMGAFNSMNEVTAAASQDPGVKDWEPEIRQYAGDPFAFLIVQTIRDYATRGIRQEGDTAVEAEVTSVDLESLEGPTVLIRACYDRSESDLVRADTGESIRPPGAPEELERSVSDVKVIQYLAEPGEPWLVSVIDPHIDQPC